MGEELVPVGENSPYAVLQMEPDETAEIIKEALGGSQLSAGDLDRVKVPSGGGTTWDVPTVDGEVSTKTLEGVIVHVASRRAFWPYTMEDRPDDADGRPECQSFDGETGDGDPGGECAMCPLNEFGSDIKGGPGKACKETRQIFLLTEGDIIPIAITIPPASLANVKTYRLRLARQRLRPSDVVTKLTIAKEKNSRGTAYGRVELSRGSTLEPAARDAMRQYVSLIQPAMAAAAAKDIDRDSVDGQ